MTRVVLHIGMHKTASTYIQKRLDANQHLLKQHAIRFDDDSKNQLKIAAIIHERVAGVQRVQQKPTQDQSRFGMPAECQSRSQGCLQEQQNKIAHPMPYSEMKTEPLVGEFRLTKKQSRQHSLIGIKLSDMPYPGEHIEDKPTA